MTKKGEQSRTVNDESLHIVRTDLQLLLHGVERDLLHLYRHAHERQQPHLLHILLMRQTWKHNMKHSAFHLILKATLRALNKSQWHYTKKYAYFTGNDFRPLIVIVIINILLLLIKLDHSQTCDGKLRWRSMKMLLDVDDADASPSQQKICLC